MSLRTGLLKVANVVRGIPAKAGIGLRTSTVAVVTKTWVGGRVGADGGSSESVLTLAPSPLVAEVNARQIASSGGRYQQGDVNVGPITPSHTGGGYMLAQLDPTVTTNGIEIFYRLTGPFAGEYSRVDVSASVTELSYTLVLRRRRTTP